MRRYVTQQVARCSDNKQTPLFRVPDGMRDDITVVAKPRRPDQRNRPRQRARATLDPELAVVAILKSKGHKADILPKGDQQGKIVAAVIEEDGWRYEVSIRFTTDGKGVWFASPLRPADGLSARQLQGLMKKNSEMACMDVFTIDADGRLCLETPNTHITVAQPFSVEEVFLQKLNRHLRTIRDSHDQWKTPNWVLMQRKLGEPSPVRGRLKSAATGPLQGSARRGYFHSRRQCSWRPAGSGPCGVPPVLPFFSA